MFPQPICLVQQNCFSFLLVNTGNGLLGSRVNNRRSSWKRIQPFPTPPQQGMNSGTGPLTEPQKRVESRHSGINFLTATELSSSRDHPLQLHKNGLAKIPNPQTSVRGEIKLASDRGKNEKKKKKSHSHYIKANRMCEQSDRKPR